VPRENVRDPRGIERANESDVLLTGDAEDEVDAFLLETLDHQVSGFHIGPFSL
jgi:hypothetical protein